MNDRPTGLLDASVNRAVGRVVAGPVDFLGRYEGEVVKQSADGKTVDVKLDIDKGDDTGIPSPSAVELRHGIPGATVFVQAGARVLVGWVGGDQQQPFAELWRDGAAVTKLILAGTELFLGAEAGANLVALSNLVHDTLVRLQTVLNVLFKATAIPVNEPGNGAPSALQLALIAAFSGAHITDVLAGDATWPDDVAAQSVNAK